MNNQKSKINEGLEYGDLKRLIRPVLQIDGFKSKMGDDDDIVVLCFTVYEKLAADDLMNFLENSYEDVLDSEVSPGEKDDGSHLVFVEMSRDPSLPYTINDIVLDILNLTEQKIEDWSFTYYRDREKRALTVENLESVIPLTPREYRARFEKKKKSPTSEEKAELNKLRAAAGVTVPSQGSQEPEIQEMQIAAGIPMPPR